MEHIMKSPHAPAPLIPLAIVALFVATLFAYDLSRDKVTYIAAESHLDTQWQWTLDGTIKVFLPNTMYRNFDIFDQFPGYVFSFEGAFRYMLMKQAYPADYARVKGYVASGNWAPVGGFVDAADVNVPCPESVVRQVLYGNGFFKDEFGKKSIDVFLPDCFGFGYALPTIAVHCGLKGFSTQKFDVWGGWRPTPFSIGRWQGVDGSILVSCLKPGSYADLQWDIRGIDGDALKTASGVWATYDYFGVGDQGGGNEDGPVTSLMSRIATNATQDIKVVLAPSDQTFRDLTPAQISALPVYDGELVMKTHGTGAYTAHADIKTRNWRNEVLAFSAEQASVIAEWAANAPYPRDALKSAWIRVLWNQMHDGVTGTSIPDAYTKYSIPALDSSIAAFSGTLTAANDGVAALLDTRVNDPAGIPMVVFNPLAMDRRDLVEASVTFPGAAPAEVRVFDAAGGEVPSQKTAVAGQTVNFAFMASVPSTGYAVYEVRPSTTACALATGMTAGATALENSQYKVTIDANGDISGIIDKRNGSRELLAQPARLEMRNDNSTQWPSWEVLYADVSAAARGYVDQAVIKRVMESGPARVSVQVKRTKDGSSFTQYYRLSADSTGFLEVANDITWNTSSTMLKAGFSLKASNPKATFDLGVGVIERPNMTANLYEVPAQQWADLTNADNAFGTAILADYKRGWDKSSDNTLHLTLIHSPSGTNYGYTGDKFQHKFSYGIYGHAGTWSSGGVVRQGLRFNNPLIAFQAGAHAGAAGKSLSFVACDPSKIAVMAVKKAESGNEYVVRIREIAGSSTPQTVSLTFPRSASVTGARELNGAEEDSVQAKANVTASGNTISLTIGKYQIRTIAFALGNVLGVRQGPGNRVARGGLSVRQARSGSIAIQLPSPAGEITRVAISDVNGRAVCTLFENDQRAASAPDRVDWDGRANGEKVRAGIYFVTVSTGAGHMSRKIKIVR
jgi:alpha-mannosidase